MPIPFLLLQVENYCPKYVHKALLGSFNSTRLCSGGSIGFFHWDYECSAEQVYRAKPRRELAVPSGPAQPLKCWACQNHDFGVWPHKKVLHLLKSWQWRSGHLLIPNLLGRLPFVKSFSTICPCGADSRRVLHQFGICAADARA